MKNINLPVELVNAVLQYLGGQPYTQVANLIAGIQQAAQAQAPAEQPKPE